ncbi:unnamed protein product [Xylocopa violacea]|uniref:Uncharacterized protein n=1 Tax=Xylocopa violacea TaxID=135666 RepID=A0ABP1PFX6_XYLVO
MSRVAVPRALFCLSAFFFSTCSKASTSYTLADDCLEFDVEELEDYLSKLNFENVPTIDMMIGGFKCPVTALPFGALKSDWARLLLLRNAQPRESVLFEKLGRLFRILAIAYFRMEERFDIEQFGSRSTSSLNVSSTHETTVSVHSGKLDNSIIEFTTVSNQNTLRNSLIPNVSRAKVKKPMIQKKVPSDNGFWKYSVISRGGTRTSSVPMSTSDMEETDRSKESSTKSEKRESLNVSTDKSWPFRWFYNFGREDKNESRNDAVKSPGIDIRCNEKILCKGKE